jgi:hypothetical protein
MRTRMLPVLVALSVPALSAAQTPVPVAPRTRLQMENAACAPDAVLIAPAMAVRVVGGYERGRMLFGPNDTLIIGAGTRQGLQSGQDYFVRRVVRDQFTPMTAASVLNSIHTAGWVRIVEARDEMAIATVTQACDGVMTGDYLEPFSEPAAVAAIEGGTPDYSRPAQLVLADERRQTGVAGDLMLIDRGGDDAVVPGQRLTIFRRTTFALEQPGYSSMPTPKMHGGGPILNIGEATVLSVRPKTSLVRIDGASDVVYIGDMVALHR